MQDVVVIYNPRAGRGKAARTVARMRRVLKGKAEFLPTRAPGHAEELAAEAASRFPIVAAAGGDGTVHEVANGLLSASAGAALAVLPVGSANDYAFSLGLSADWWERADPSIGIRAVDVGRVEGGDGRRRWFINCFGIGFNGHVTRQARKIKSLRGIPLYALAVLRAMTSSFRHPELSIRMDDAEGRALPTLSMTLGLGRREGNFLLTPDAILDDGLFDYIHVGRLGRAALLRYVPRMISGNIPRDDPAVVLGRCRTLDIEAGEPLMAHGDGEFFCQPEEHVRRLRIELVAARMRVLARLPRLSP